MDERRLKYLYATLAVAFGLPSLVVGGAAATMLLLTGLGQFGHGTLAAVTVMPLWGLAGIAGCLAWLWLSAGYLLQGRAGLQVHRLWWWLLLAGGLAAVPRWGWRCGGASPSTPKASPCCCWAHRCWCRRRCWCGSSAAHDVAHGRTSNAWMSACTNARWRLPACW